ncbi:alpha/beta hydrolase [Planctomicrobium piriforme]|uniref:Acetyl esterase/lipase n=1 Tax=Planctomicrobium piriforme TaxID=1576369 RepID=A0A1I3QAE4_9PLAN|nr:alpha/beta hydrolase [Planctomicrobium piriforme]SFJ30076.1 Acetyl esterase/lipase [Planctomicrobium piriforme]
MNRFALAFSMFLFCAPALGMAAEPITLPLWPDRTLPPLPKVSEETTKWFTSIGGPNPARVTDVTTPTITVYRPEHPNGTSVIVAPGGGYVFLSWKHEGTQVCEWLNSIGVTAVLLKYRTPTRDDAAQFTMPVEDAQRALGIVRHHATEWGLDPQRVGLLGFSAGANLAGHAAWDNLNRTYPQNPDFDDPRGPDFLVFIYGGGFTMKDQPTKLREEVKLPALAPPAFFLVAHDDKNNPVEAALLYLEYKKLNRPADLHIFTKGGHGFGMRDDKHPINDWPQMCAEWMQSLEFIPKAK